MIIILWWGLMIATYLVYPLVIRMLAKNKNLSQFQSFDQSEDLPTVGILIAAHNEEEVLEQKLDSILSSQYDLTKVHIYLGLDDCSDRSLEIVESFKFKYPDSISFIESKRVGKPQMLNLLMESFQPQTDLCVFTDANVFFKSETLYELLKYFKTAEIGLVDSKYSLAEELISQQHENTYLSYEQKLKYEEGLAWGTMQGPFGGCFAIRTKLFQTIPENYLVDDFFIGMTVMKSGFLSILNPKALVIEEVHTTWEEEFSRKKRIATGNFQNLKHFSSIFKKPFTSLSVSWFFHKVLRWVLPLLFIGAVMLSFVEIFYLDGCFLPLLITLSLLIGVVTTYYILQRLNLRLRTIERLSYFIYINLALVQGFLLYQKGVKSNVWKPTQRK
ncbi:MAG TPA: glycosyltransferase [Chitinophagales bacterium]|nr:glycosyltransferase [Chitinophagales bacterium]